MFSLTILNVLKVYETRLDGHSSFESHVHVIVCLLTKSNLFQTYELPINSYQGKTTSSGCIIKTFLYIVSLRFLRERIALGNSTLLNCYPPSNWYQKVYKIIRNVHSWNVYYSLYTFICIIVFIFTYKEECTCWVYYVLMVSFKGISWTASHRTSPSP